MNLIVMIVCLAVVVLIAFGLFRAHRNFLRNCSALEKARERMDTYKVQHPNPMKAGEFQEYARLFHEYEDAVRKALR